ncbi:MAG: hypothetical protein NTW87_30230 [Planctomycetota bacterium]|nr:hypothetical protein [Planctomycetota bacterium]
MSTRPPRPLAFKPDLEDAARRWDAYFAGDIIDRPVVCVTAPKPGYKSVPGANYRERVCGDLYAIIDRALHNAEATYFGGEAVPSFWTSFGPDEIAVFCGAELRWSDDSGDTNWSAPFIADWEEALPLRIQNDHPLWRRMLDFYRLAAERIAGKMAMSPLDLHSNMDILAPVRGPQRLCMDLLDRPEAIDRAMASARAIFPVLWNAIREAGRMDELGYCSGFYSMEGAAVLQCDFSCMISPAMFRRWVLPALEEEAAIVKHAYYHWDGPGAQVHTAALCASRGLHTLSYVPGDGRGAHIEYLDLFKRVQAGGKAVHFWGTPDECKRAHRELRPEKTMYSTSVKTPAEADALLKWFVQNT